MVWLALLRLVEVSSTVLVLVLVVVVVVVVVARRRGSLLLLLLRRGVVRAEVEGPHELRWSGVEVGHVLWRRSHVLLWVLLVL